MFSEPILKVKVRHFISLPNSSISWLVIHVYLYFPSADWQNLDWPMIKDGVHLNTPWKEATPRALECTGILLSASQRDRHIHHRLDFPGKSQGLHRHFTFHNLLNLQCDKSSLHHLSQTFMSIHEWGHQCYWWILITSDHLSSTFTYAKPPLQLARLGQYILIKVAKDYLVPSKASPKNTVSW